MAPVPHGMEGYAKKENSLVSYWISELYTGGYSVYSTISSRISACCVIKSIKRMHRGSFYSALHIIYRIFKRQCVFALSFFFVILSKSSLEHPSQAA